MKYNVISDACVMTCRMDNSRTVGDTDSPQLEKTGNNLTYGKKLLKNCIEV